MEKVMITTLDNQTTQSECLKHIVVLVAQSCPTLCDPTECSLPGSSVHGILQARILEWVAIPFSRVSSWPRDQTQVSCIAGRFFTTWAIGKSEECFMELASSWEPVTLETLPWESSRSNSLLSFGCKRQTFHVMQGVQSVEWNASRDSRVCQRTKGRLK